MRSLGGQETDTNCEHHIYIIIERNPTLTIDHMLVGSHLLEVSMELLLAAAAQLLALLLLFGVRLGRRMRTGTARLRTRRAGRCRLQVLDRPVNSQSIRME